MVLLVVGLCHPIQAAEKCNRPLTQLSARAWEEQFLIPRSEAPPLEERFRGKPLFYALGSHLGMGLNSVSFSNDLPPRLISDEVREDHSQRYRLFGTLKEPLKLSQLPALWKLETEVQPIHTPFGLANVALGIRNLALFPFVEVPNMYTTAMETGPWLPRMKQFYKRPNLHFFNSYLSPKPTAETLSPLGKQFASHLPGKTFMDLGSGDPNRAVAHRAVAQKMGAKDYVGVDTALPWLGRTRRGEFPELSEGRTFTSRYIKEDILTFLRRLKRPGPMFMRIEGLEVYKQDEDAMAYLQETMKQMAKVAQPGDVLSVGATVSYLHPKPTKQGADRSQTIDPADYGFRLIEGQAPEEGWSRAEREYIWVKE